MSLRENVYRMTENDISRIIVDVCYHIHVELGPGLLESIYEEILYQELKNEGFRLIDKNLCL